MQKLHDKNWKVKLYHALQKNEVDYSLTGDMREADRLNFLELDRDSTVLLVGGGWGHTMFSLSGRCKEVFVLEPDPRQCEFLKQRKEEDSCENVVLRYVSGQTEIETFVAGKVFDNIIVEESHSLKARGVLYRTLIRSLKSGGEIYIAVCRRGSFRFARNFVRRMGLQDIKSFIVIPGHRVPLFFLPLYSIDAMRYFFHNLFYLITTIPPEKRGNYRFVIGIASVAVKVLPVRLLAFLLRTFFLSKAIIARKA